MTDSKMPERIWSTDDGAFIMAYDFNANIAGITEYIRADLAHPAPVADAELEALVQRAEAIDPVLEVEFDTQMDVERNPYGAREAIEDALYLIRDLSTTLRARTAQPVGVTVKPLEWQADPYNEGDYQFWRAKAGEYIYEVGCDRTYWWQEDGAANICAIDGFPSGDAAKAAAQADYEQRIRSQVVVAPITVQDAAKVLLDGLSLRTVGQDHPQITPEMTIAASMFLSALLPEGGA